MALVLGAILTDDSVRGDDGTPADPARLVVRATDGGVAIAGVVPTVADREAVIAPARDAAVAVAGQLEISDNVAATPWLRDIGPLIVLISRVDRGRLTTSREAIRLAGTVATADDRDTLGARARAALAQSGTRVVNATRVAASTPDLPALQAELNQHLASHPITFETASSELTAGARGALDEIARVLNRAAFAVQIAGYTDNEGESERNIALSGRRATAVRAYLIGTGVPAARLTAKGFGPANPIATNSTEEGRAANRRIEIHLQEG